MKKLLAFCLGLFVIAGLATCINDNIVGIAGIIAGMYGTFVMGNRESAKFYTERIKVNGDGDAS